MTMSGWIIPGRAWGLQAFFLADSSIQAWGSVGDLGAAEAGRALDSAGAVFVAPLWIWP
jgi:hypothetical protein